jgi:hypothetical protein
MNASARSLPWWLPYAIGGFMLTPYALWAGLYLGGMAGPKSGFSTPEMVVLLVASLPLAASFFLANLGQMASAMRSGPAGERLPRAALAMPWLSGLFGLAGVGVLLWLGRAPVGIALVALVVAGMVALMVWGLRDAPAAAAESASEPVTPEEEERAVWLVVTPLLLVVFLALAWSPAVLFYAALAAVPGAFVAILALAHEGTGGAP